MTESIRLVKRVAELASCSRAEAAQYIEGGWVKVDGQLIEEPGFRVLPQQQVELVPDAKLQPVEPVTILLHKPAGLDAPAAQQLITPGNLYAEDRSGNRFLKRHAVDLIATDPGETTASGLLVLTQDWRIKRKLVDDAARIEHEYIAEVAGALKPDGLALLNHGLKFNGKPLPPIKVSWQSDARLRFAIKAPARGLITHMCEQVGLTVLSLKRIRIGRIPLAGLPEGQWRYLLGYERF
ncbi:MAG: RNA-binding protein [Burkholderiales bacterium RIFCSPLOWO2_02_FULL_57_36]|nr:MAG: RNA-binding protein [Burkholderiales bacterium RIFCSPLOWO2_02_FULL_57_36]